MMKRIISAILILIILISCCSCARKSRPPFEIKHESVNAIEFRRTSFLADNPFERSYFQKTVDNKEDIEKLLLWIEELSLEKHEPIEVPIEQVQYVIVLKGVKDHKLVFMNEYVVYDSTAFTYKSEKQMTQVSQKYNLLNYAETPITTLGLI